MKKMIISLAILCFLSANLFAQPLSWDELQAKKGYHSLDAAANDKANCYKLYYTHNNMTYIPDEISRIEKLQVIDFTENQIGFITSEIGNLDNLQKLYLGKNKIEYLPEEFSQLQNLIVLDLSDNLLSSVPNALKKLSNLKTLYLKGNPIPDEEIEALRGEMPDTEIIF